MKGEVGVGVLLNDLNMRFCYQCFIVSYSGCNALCIHKDVPIYYKIDLQFDLDTLFLLGSYCAFTVCVANIKTI